MNLAENKINRIMISATGSGCGKTTIVTGLLKYYKDNGINVHAFKCGPDYIDPMYHRSVIGVPSKNLDPFFCDDDLLKASFYDSAFADVDSINIIEGAMGLFDGIGATSEASSYSVARTLDCPIVLIVDAKGAGYSLIPVIKGFLSSDESHLIKGVILNNISKDFYERISPVIEAECSVKILGYLSKNKELELGSRHLGLKTPEENELSEKFKILKAAIKDGLLTDEIISLSKEAKDLTVSRKLADYVCNGSVENTPVIAVAKDDAFSFYYEDNINALELCGARLTYFSPLKDKALPDNTAGVILGGGYPELFVDELKSNASMINALKEATEKGMPLLAECGGFMYLNYIGLLNGDVFSANKSVRFGYINISDEKYVLKGHEFHHYDVTETGDEFEVSPANGKPSYKAIVRKNNITAGFPHLYYFSDIRFGMDFVQKAVEYGNE